MRLLALSCFLFSISGFTHSLGFPDGEYRGEGYWRSAEGEGNYSAIVELWNDEIWLNYSWEHEGERSEIAATIAFWVREDGTSFDVGYNGLWVGEGSLVDGVATYNAIIEGYDIWASISYTEVGLHIEGRKSKDGEVISWSEWLYPWSEGSEPGAEPGEGTGQWDDGWDNDQGQGQTGGDAGQGQTGGSDEQTGVGGGSDVWPVPEEGAVFPGMIN